MIAGYRAPSGLTRSGDALNLGLQTALGATPSGLVQHPLLFSGILTRPDVAASGLLAVADVAAARYADAGLAQRLASLDPVVTASGDRLRFESFSACNGVYSRFDLLPEGMADSPAFGTTNVDINPPLRSALASVGRADLLHLAVGPDHLQVSTLTDTHLERQVELPDRWVRGFAEVPTLASGMTQVAEVPGSAARAFFARLRRPHAPPGPSSHVAPAARGIREVIGPTPGSVHLAGTARLAAARRLLRFTGSLRIFAGAEGSSGWCFEVPGGRFTLLLSPEPFRGFSGEGSLLHRLAEPRAEESGRRLLTALGWEPLIDVPALAARTGLDLPAAEAGIAWLAASGRVGFDLAEGHWFHRELPVDADLVLKRNPRLRAAEQVVTRDGVTAHGAEWRVVGDQGTYRITRDGERLRCTCPWEWNHQGSRGPCKHVLAVVLAQRAARS